MSVKLLNSKIQATANKLLQNGERLRIEYSGKQLEKIPEMKAFIDTLGLKNPKVLVGSNGRGDSMVAGIAIKDGDKVVLRAAAGVDYTAGSGQVVQLRSRVGQGEGRLNLIADTGKEVNANNMAASVSNRGGKLDVSVDTDMMSGNLKVDTTKGEMKHPLLKMAYERLGEKLSRGINTEMKSVVEIITENTKRIKQGVIDKKIANEGAFITNKKPKVIKDLSIKEDKNIKDLAKDLCIKGEKNMAKAEIAKVPKWRQDLNDEDSKFLIRKAEELKTTVFDEAILKDPEVIERFKLK